MTSLLAAQALLTARFEPPMIFPGERFHVTLSRGASLSDFTNVKLKGSGNSYDGVAVRPPARFVASVFADDKLVDGAEFDVPLAPIPRWSAWPPRSGENYGAFFLISTQVRVAVVPTESGYGLCKSEVSGEKRWHNVIYFDIAVRSGPSHSRPYRANYVYNGKDRITLIAEPEKVLHLNLNIQLDKIEAIITARFALKGTVRLLNSDFAIDMNSGDTRAFTASY